MKILYHHRTASKDGQYVHIQEMIACLRDLGNEVIVVGPTSKTTSFGGVARGVSGLRARLPRALYEVLELCYSIFDFIKLSIAVSRHKPDIIYERYNLLLPSGIWMKQIFGLPMILEVNAPLYEERSAHSGLTLHGLARWSQNYVWRHADMILTVTGVLAKIVQNSGIDGSRIQVVPNGVDTSVYCPRPAPSTLHQQLQLQRRVVVGFVGFAREWHGLDRVLRALTVIDPVDWHFLVVGDGPACAPLIALAEELKCADRVSVTGLVERDCIADHLALFDIAVQPDVVEYASPLKLFEYMASGVAVLAIDRPNIREVLTEGVDALLFPPDDEAAFVSALQLLCCDPALRSKLSANAMKTINEREFHWKANALRVERIAQDLIACRAERST